MTRSEGDTLYSYPTFTWIVEQIVRKTFFKEEKYGKKKEIQKKKNHEKKRPLDKIIISSLMISPIVLGGVLLSGQQATQATEADGKWEARSIEQIKKDVEGKKESIIVQEDTLNGISLATNVTMDKLASLNGIGDYNLIYAGNKLDFEGNIVTVQNKKVCFHQMNR